MTDESKKIEGCEKHPGLILLKTGSALLVLTLLPLVSCSAPGREGYSGNPGAPYQANAATDRDFKSQGSASGNGSETEEGKIVVKKADDANVCYIVPTPELKAKLSPEQYAVLVESGTEPPFRNAFWNNHEAGIYVDAIDGTPLFTSLEKYDSGTGWPSFWNPVSLDKMEFVEDLSYGMRRVEIRSKSSGGHLGHLFDDGPEPTGMRYCINSASLRFIPVADLEKEGYADLKARFR